MNRKIEPREPSDLDVLDPSASSGSSQLRSRLAAAMNAELVEDPVHVVLDGRELDRQASSDGFVGQSLGDQLGNLRFARRQRVREIAGARPLLARACQERVGDVGRTRTLPAGGASKNFHKLVWGCLGRYESRHAGAR